MLVVYHIFLLTFAESKSIFIMEIIYHYTSVDSLLGMLSNSTFDNPQFTFWASHCLFLNDLEERRKGEKLCLQLLPSVEEELSIPVDERISTYIDDDKFQKMMSSSLKDLESEIMNHVSIYVISFSKKRDFLPMWNLYSQNGNGIALGFDRVPMREDLTTLSFAIPYCTYNADIHDLKNEIKSIYLECKITEVGAIDILKRKGLNEKQLKVASCAMTLAWLFNTVAVKIKSDFFSYEEEARIITQENRTVKFRNSKGNIIPYMEIPISAKYLKEIIIGPTQDYERIIIPISKFLKSKGIDPSSILIEKSKAPFRS